MTNKNEIIVEDMNNRRLVFYSLEGEFLKNVSTAKRSIMNVKVDSKGNIMGVFIDYENLVYTLAKFDSELNYISSIESSPLPNPQVFDPFFSIFQWCITNDDHVVFGYPEKYEYKIFDPKGKLVKKIDKEYDPIEITKEDIEETTRNFPPRMKSRKLDIPRYHPAYKWLIADDENRMFVQTWEKTEDREAYYYDVFDSDGRYIAKIPLKFRPRIWKKNKLYFIEKDKGGFQIVKRYKITWRR